MPVLGRLLVLWCVLLVVVVISARQLRFGRTGRSAPRWPDMTRAERLRYTVMTVGLLTMRRARDAGKGGSGP